LNSLKRKRTKAQLDGDEDDLEDEFEDGDYDDTKKGKPFARSDSLRAKQHASKEEKQKAAKAKGNAAVIMRLDDDDEAVRRTCRKVKEAYDRSPPGNDNDHLSPSDDDEHSQHQESGQKCERKGKNNKHMCGQQHTQLSAKLSACARLATHDVSPLLPP
jgi:hypothetical protein